MAAEYFLYRQIKHRLKNDRAYAFYAGPELSETERLKVLCSHYNGHIRQRAVLCLGLKRETVALPQLVARVNDWVDEVARSARSSLRRWFRPEFAGVFVEGLPEIFWLLKCTRADHRAFVNEIVRYLGREENTHALLTRLKSGNAPVARLCLRLLLDHPQFSHHSLFDLAMCQQDPVVRHHITQFILSRPEDVSSEILIRLLADRFAPVKQQALQYVQDHHLNLAKETVKRLMLDNNSLVRQRACRLYQSHYGDPLAVYLGAFDDAGSRPALRKAALLGLDELRYPQVITLAESIPLASPFGLYFAALNLIVKHKGDDARELLIALLTNAEPAVARAARRIILRQKLLVTLTDLQLCLAHAPSSEHALLAYSLAHRLNKWDWLIFLMRNATDETQALTQQAIAEWQSYFNRSATEPSAAQREQLAAFLTASRYAHLQHFLR